MATLSTWHEVLTDGVGKCSKPMWWGWGGPAGFCDKPAYGKQEVGQMRSGEWVRGRFVPSYCDGLACYAHGGPKEKVVIDKKILSEADVAEIESAVQGAAAPNITALISTIRALREGLKRYHRIQKLRGGCVCWELPRADKPCEYCGARKLLGESNA